MIIHMRILRSTAVVCPNLTGLVQVSEPAYSAFLLSAGLITGVMLLRIKSLRVGKK